MKNEYRKGQDMRKPKEKLHFYEWYRTNWTAYGGLISKATAAAILNVTKARITQMIKKGMLKERIYENNQRYTYVDAPSVFTLAHHQNYEYIINETQKMDDLPEELKKFQIEIYKKLKKEIE